jgi:Cu/Ag efflux protein CusF
MIKSLVVAASLSAMLVSSAAFAAAALTDKAAIKSIDAKTNSITLDDGKSFTLPAKFDLKTIRVGEKVMVTYDMKDKLMVASAVTAG